MTANGSGSGTDLIAINEASTSYSQRRTRFRIDYLGNAYLPSGSLSVGSSVAPGHITASGNISGSATSTLTIGGLATFGTNTVVINGTAGHITASGNISMSGHFSASSLSATSASFLNINVTGSGKEGTGSFGRINVEHVVIHTHETVGGDGLTVNGLETNLGGTSDLSHIIRLRGHVTASGDVNVTGKLKVTGSISGSSIHVTELFVANDLMVSGSVSGSHISASKGLWTSGSLYAKDLSLIHI